MLKVLCLITPTSNKSFHTISKASRSRSRKPRGEYDSSLLQCSFSGNDRGIERARQPLTTVRSSEWIKLEEAAGADRTICTVLERPLLYGVFDLGFVQNK